MKKTKTQDVVIGSGPAGEGAAMQLSKAGREVTVVERFGRVGGGCTHWNTIPSQALRFAIFRFTEALQNPLLNSLDVRAKFSFADLRKQTQDVINQQESLRRGFYQRNRVQVVSGQARFENANRLMIDAETQIEFENAIIATGSRPYRPPAIDFEHSRIFDSDKILLLDEMPRTLTVYGAGVVGCEYASMFRNLGIKVNLINSRESLLDFLDDEVSDALSYHMREQGVVIRHNEQFESLQTHQDHVQVKLESAKEIKSDIFLWANGRTGNSDQLGLESIGLAPDSRGYLKVDKYGQTSLDNVYAVGDVVGFPSLASAAYTQGRTAARRLLGHELPDELVSDFPTGIYTSPEISSIGKTETELTELKVPYEIGRAQFKDLARAQITGRPVGMLKLIFHRETLELLGVHCFGPNASEIIHIGHAVMAGNSPEKSIAYFINSTFNYPTMAEAYRVAALNGLNRL